MHVNEQTSNGNIRTNFVATVTVPPLTAGPNPELKFLCVKEEVGGGRGGGGEEEDEKKKRLNMNIVKPWGEGGTAIRFLYLSF